MARTNTRTLAEVVGEQVRSARQAQQMSQDRLAALMRGLGADWNQNAVSAFEKGERRLDVEELTLLAVALNAALPTFFAVEETVRLTASATVVAANVGRVLAGEPSAIERWKWTEVRSTVRRTVEDVTRRWPELAANVARLTAADEAAAGQAERKAARRLGVPAVEVARAAEVTWGRSLTEQRDRTVAETAPADSDARTVQAFRGHVTRLLVDELESVLAARPRQRRRNKP